MNKPYKLFSDEFIIDAKRYFTSTKCPDFADSKPQRDNRPLKADGQAGIIAWQLLYEAQVGSYATIQGVSSYLAHKGIVSNDPSRRLREAVKWLEREGCTVHKEWVEGKSRYMRWRVEWNDAAQKAYNKLTKAK